MDRFCILGQLHSIVYFHCGKIKAICDVNARSFVGKFFFSFYFLNALQSDNNTNKVYVFWLKYVFGPSQRLILYAFRLNKKPFRFKLEHSLR